MSPLHAIWICSLLGALLFFCLGWAISVLRRAPAQATSEESLATERTRLQDELQRATAERLSAEQSRDGAKRELDQAREQLELGQVQAAEWQRTIARLREEARTQQTAMQELQARHREESSSAQARIGALDVQLRALREGNEDRGGVVRELSAVQARLASEQKALRETRAQLEKAQRAVAELAERDKKDKARDAELQALRSQVQDLMERCRQAEQKSSELGSGLAAADAEYKTMSARLSEAQQRATALQAQQTASMSELQELRSEAQRSASFEAENGRLQAELRSFKASNTASGDRDQELVELRKAMHDAKLRLGAAQAKEGEAERLRAQSATLRDQLGELPELRAKAAELEQLRAEHRTLRVDLAIAQRRCEEQQSLVNAHTDLERKLQELSHDAAEAASLRQRVAALEPLALAQLVHSPARPRGPVNGSPRSPDDALAAVRRTPGFRSVAIASNLGLLVHGDGLSEHWEALAATGGLVTRFIENVLSLLPLGSIQLVHVHGAHDTVLSCWVSGDETEPLVISALGVGAPVTREVWQSVANPMQAIQVA